MKSACVKPRKSEELGFAVLMVFVLAAVIAITLYMEMPRVAFEAQRTKEQLLIDRGDQYKRAIQLFYRKNKRFPTTMDELEKFQEVRYLRRRYKDPMTNKDEWRIIHVGPSGQLTDSLVQKQQNPLGQNGSNGQQASNGQNGQSGFGGQSGSNGQSNPGFGSSFGSQGSNGNQPPPTQYNANGIPISGADADPSGGPPSGINMAVARRPSDSMNLGQGPTGTVNPSDPNQPQDPNQAASTDPNQTSSQDPNQAQNSGQPNGNQTNANQTNGLPSRYPGQYPPGFPGQPGQPYIPGQLPYQNQSNNGQQSSFNNGNNGGSSFNNGGSSFNNGGSSFNNGGSSFNNGGSSFNSGGSFNNGSNNGNNSSNSAGGNAALNSIQNSLFSARPSSSSFSNGNSNTTGGGVGIAGVATKYKGPSIKVVNERKKYQEWEFVYDMKKDKSLLGAAGVNALQNAQNPGQGQNAPGFSSFGGNQNSNGSSFGNNSNSSFGSGSSSQSQSQSQTQTQPQQQQQQ